MDRRIALGGTLDRYVGRLFLSSYATAFMVIVGLFITMDMAGNLDEFLEPWDNGETVATSVIVRYYLASTPFLFLQAAPFITLIAGLFSLTRLLRHNEIAAAMAAGISARRILLPIFVGGILAAACMVAVREYSVHTIQPLRESLHYVLRKRSYDLHYRTLRLKDLSGSHLRLGEYRPGDEETPPEAVDIAAYMRKDGVWTSSITADRAVYTERDGEWGLELAGGERTAVSERHEVTQIDWLGSDEFEFNPELALTFHRGRENPLELSFSEARDLGSRDPDNVVYQTLLQYHLTFPLANLVLLLVGLPMLMRHERSRGIEGLAKGLLLCLFFFAADFICRNLGIQGALDPFLASWLPVLLFGSLGVVLYDSMPS